jgi:hypothetical protein
MSKTTRITSTPDEPDNAKVSDGYVSPEIEAARDGKRVVTKIEITEEP